MSISIVDLDRVLDQFTMSLWRTFGELTFWSFVGNIVLLSWTGRRNWIFDWSGGLLRKNLMFYVMVLQFFLLVYQSAELVFPCFLSGKHCLSFSWIENTPSDTGIRFLCGWIIRCRDESARLRVWNIFSDFIFWISFSLMKCWRSLDETLWRWPQLEHFR